MVWPDVISTSTVTRDDGDDDGQQHAAHLGPQLHDTGSGGHEQQREDAGQEQADLLHIVQLDEAQQQGSQQQDQAVDAGRDGQRQNSVAELAQKTERKDACELKQILRKKSPFIAPAQPPFGAALPEMGLWQGGPVKRSPEDAGPRVYL